MRELLERIKTPVNPAPQNATRPPTCFFKPTKILFNSILKKLILIILLKFSSILIQSDNLINCTTDLRLSVLIVKKLLFLFTEVKPR